MAAMRDTVSLDGIWSFIPDPSAEGERNGFATPGYDPREWGSVPVPSCFETGSRWLDHYQGVCWYRRNVKVPGAWSGKRISIRFQGVNYRARVFLDGRTAGENGDGFLPFEIDVTGLLIPGNESVLAVEVDNSHHPGDVPGCHVGWRGFGGILRSVTAEAADPARIESIVLKAGHSGSFTADATVKNARGRQITAGLSLSVTSPDGTVLLEQRSSEFTVEAGGAETITFSADLPGAVPWSPQKPVLHTARAELLVDGKAADEMAERFGFRTVEADQDGIRLNGDRIFITGFNRHEDSPRTAMAVDTATTRRDLVEMKEAGANTVRLCHYPHDPSELSMCDELGLLVFAEIPLYFWNDERDGLENREARCSSAARQLERMIVRDRNHPSIIFWSVSNETSEQIPEIAADNRELIRKARALDPTRLCVHVSNHWKDHPEFEEDDVVCVNGYPSMAWDNGPRARWPDPDRSGAAWREDLSRLHERYPGKPILVTEFGYCSFPGTYGHRFGEDTHALVLEEEYRGFDAPYVTGALAWCWADHPWPAGRFLGGLAMSPFGVVSRERTHLLPFHAVRALFRRRLGL